VKFEVIALNGVSVVRSVVSSFTSDDSRMLATETDLELSTHLTGQLGWRYRGG
jgi:hypothetical protein